MNGASAVGGGPITMYGPIRPFHALALVLACLLACEARIALASELRVLIENSAEMPFAGVRNGQVVAGIQFDLSQLIAARLGLRPRIYLTPRKRIGATLEAGEADIACALLPQWLAADVLWTKRFLPHAGVVVTLASARRPTQLSDLAGERIGTVLGYQYVELETALGRNFVREDAPNVGAVLRKLDKGRTRNAAVNLQFLEYQRKLNLQTAPLHPYIYTGAYETSCALSRKSAVKTDRINAAIDTLIGEGAIQAMMNRYRPAP